VGVGIGGLFLGVIAGLAGLTAGGSPQPRPRPRSLARG
jgi:hypothetical protein